MSIPPLPHQHLWLCFWMKMFCISEAPCQPLLSLTLSRCSSIHACLLPSPCLSLIPSSSLCLSHLWPALPTSWSPPPPQMARLTACSSLSGLQPSLEQHNRLSCQPENPHEMTSHHKPAAWGSGWSLARWFLAPLPSATTARALLRSSLNTRGFTARPW